MCYSLPCLSADQKYHKFLRNGHDHLVILELIFKNDKEHRHAAF